ncbi:MAG: HPr family phosphocarrier protein [Clostridia bacterium]|nr:HPr family phosphocarrier protein [Clostridia bacterium]
MKTFTHEIKDPVGLHARPAGLLVKKAKEFQSEISLEKEGAQADAKKLMALMGLGAVKGDQIKVTISGPDEDEAYKAFMAHFQENL